MYQCTDCLKSFHNKSNLNRHVSQKHPKVSTDDDFSEDEMNDDSSTNVSDMRSDGLSSDEDGFEDEKEEGYIDVWKTICEESVQNNISIYEQYKEKVLFAKSLRKDGIHQAIMETIRKSQEEDNMDFLEALDYAVHKRRFLIQRCAMSVNEEDAEN